MSADAGFEGGSASLTELGDALAETGAESLAGQRGEMVESLLRTALTMWEDPQVGPRLLGALRSAVTSEEGAAQLREFMSTRLFAQWGQALDESPMNIDQVAEMLGVPALNINAFAAQVWGVGMLRYVLKLEPIASASVDEVIDLLIPTGQRYLAATAAAAV